MKLFTNLRENVKDFTPNRNNGIATNVTFIDDSVRGYVAEFEETAEVVLPTAEELNITDQDFTVATWVKIPEYIPGKTDYCIIGAKNSSYQQGLQPYCKGKEALF